MFEFTQKITREKLRSFLIQHKTDSLVLDIGSKKKPYADLFPNTIAFDINYYNDLDFVADAHYLPIKNESFDFLLSTEVLEHTHNPQKVIDEIYRVLKPKGKLLLTTRFIFPIHDAPHDYFRFTKYGLAYLLRNFEKVEIFPETSTLETISVLFQRIAFQSIIMTKIPVLNILFHLIARFILSIKGIIKQEYGDINREAKEVNIMSSGYYVVAIKK